MKSKSTSFSPTPPRVGELGGSPVLTFKKTKFMVKFAKYEGNANLNDLGTLKSIIGKGGTLKFSDKNFNSTRITEKGTRVKVVVVAKKKDGTSALIPCSNTVSEHLRAAREKGAKKVQMLGWLAGLSIVENEEGLNFISMPAGEESEGFSIDSLEVVETSEFLPEETIA